MERTVPRSSSDEIDLYVRTIYSLLRSTTEVQIRTLEEIHTGINSSLHPDARKPSPDASAFIYSILRLPDCMQDVRLIVLGQSADVFEHEGYSGIESWRLVSARARRRRCFYDGRETLACFIASRSDIDDVIPTLVAYQIEWNKLHFLLGSVPQTLIQETCDGSEAAATELASHLQMSVDDLARFKKIWGSAFVDTLTRIAHNRVNLAVRLLGGSLSQYWRATRAWWDNIEQVFPELLTRPVYFISSNMHSITNLLSGYALQQEGELINYLNHSNDVDLIEEWKSISSGDVSSSKENLLYYVLRRYAENNSPNDIEKRQGQFEKKYGITRVNSEHYFSVDAQVIELCRLDPTLFDSRIGLEDLGFLSNSDALILNIDYPLGLAAYNLLAKVAEHANPILGVYTMGKAATLNGRLGDVMVPNVVHDEHSQNTYLFQNVFSATDVVPYLMYGTVLDNQKAVSVLSTFLQNANYMDVFYREGFSDIEMEAGSFLSAVYEMYRPKRHPINEIVNLYGVPFDVGILHYASDTPMSKGRNLGAGALSYQGMDSTYATSIAILRRIFQVERQRQEIHFAYPFK